MNYNQARKIDKIYKEITNNKIKTRITLNEKKIFIELITGRKIKTKKNPLIIPLLQTTQGGAKELPNWLKGGKK